MIWALIKTILSFSFYFLLLTIPVAGSPLFYHIHQYTSPITQHIYQLSLGRLIDKGQQSLNVTKEIIQSKTDLYSDHISKTSSSFQREKEIKEILGKEGKHITQQEKERLRQVLEQSL